MRVARRFAANERIQRERHFTTAFIMMVRRKFPDACSAPIMIWAEKASLITIRTPPTVAAELLNKPDGTYLNEFRMNESVDISYTKFHHQTPIDDNPFDLVQPPENQLYVGWTQPGEWFNMTVDVKRAGVYTVDLLYTSNRGGKISLDLNGKPLVSSIDIISTKNEKETVAWRQWHHWNLDDQHGRSGVAQRRERFDPSRRQRRQYEFCLS